MAAGITDKFNKVINGTTRPVATTLSAQKLSGANSATVVATTGWDTDTAVHGIMYRTDASGNKVAGSQIDFKATVSGTTLSNFTVTAGTDDTYAIGATVELAPTAAWGDDFATGMVVEHTQTGTHSAVTATSLVTTGAITAGNGFTVSAGSVTLPSASLSQAALPLGAVVQIVNTVSSAVNTGTTTIPLDDTIPQITEGNEYMTLAITPKSTTNILVIEVIASLTNDAAGFNMNGAIFQDATANALAAGSQFGSTGGASLMFPLRHTMVAGTTSSTTFRFRAGANTAGTTTFNGRVSNRLFGAITKSSIVITEYKAS